MPPASSDKEEDGIFKRLAKALFASPSSPLTAFADRQRVERLEQCRHLEAILTACQATHEAQKRLSKDAKGNELVVNTWETEEKALITSKSGMRIARFFQWTSSHSDLASDELDDSEGRVVKEATVSFTNEKPIQDSINLESTRNVRFSKACAKEAHELWACRALALG